MSRPELDWIAQAAAPCTNTVIEIGVWKGRSTWQWCEHTPGQVIGIDSWEGNQYESEKMMFKSVAYAAGRNRAIRQAKLNLSKWITAGKLELIVSDSVEAAKVIAKRNLVIDLVFLDGSHEYPAVKKDIAAYLPLIRPGGRIAGHDADFAGVIQATNELPGSVEVEDRMWIYHVNGQGEQ